MLLWNISRSEFDQCFSEYIIRNKHARTKDKSPSQVWAYHPKLAKPTMFRDPRIGITD